MIATNLLIEAFNKVDCLAVGDLDKSWIEGLNSACQIAISARDGTGCNRLIEMLDSCLTSDREIVELSLGATDGKAVAWLYRHGEVLSRTEEKEEVLLRVRIDPLRKAQFEQRFAVKLRP